MPTYEYQCTRCGQLTSEFKPMTAPRRQRCPACRGKVELQISGGLGVVFKGDGFYINDSRKSAAARSAKPAGETKPDAAPVATPDAKSGASGTGMVHDSGSGAKDKD
jgi:putative FmdB family regulatory protein